MSGNDYDNWDLVLFLTEGSFWYILINEDRVVIPMMTEIDESFRGFYGAYKSSVDKIIPIWNLLPWKTT